MCVNSTWVTSATENPFAASPACRPAREERRVLYLQHLARLFGKAALASTEYLEHDWAGDPWSRGCLSHLPPGALTAAGPALRETVGRVHFAGSERATRWAGYMDGAVRSGEAVADALDALLARASAGGPA